MKLPYKRCSPQSSGNSGESGKWGTAHIYQSAVNAFSAFTKWQPMPMRKLSPTVLKRFENFLRQRNWLEYGIPISKIRLYWRRKLTFLSTYLFQIRGAG